MLPLEPSHGSATSSPPPSSATIRDGSGFLPSFRCPDVEGALREAVYALATLKADGIGVLSSYEGKYLGNPHYAPLMEELNRRRAVVYCHPYCAACGAQTELTDAQNRGVEFVFDTTRTILSVLQTGASARFSDIRFIWSHGGGTVPFITSRLMAGLPMRSCAP
jgi:6-methylsalicylate decarboxylase